MGMFDYYDIDVSLLPSVPPELPTKDGRCVFQTKDTYAQGMLRYVQDRCSVLMLKKVIGEWVDGKRIEKSTENSIMDVINSFGHFVQTDVTYEPQSYSGTICFYTSLRHPESDGSDRYKNGWIEYVATYTNGYLLKIELDSDASSSPRKLTDKELQEERDYIEECRNESRERLIKSRKQFPTQEQRLIDSISTLIDDRESMYDTADLIRTINNIQQLIEEYRERHDPFYTKP